MVLTFILDDCQHRGLIRVKCVLVYSLRPHLKAISGGCDHITFVVWTKTQQMLSVFQWRLCFSVSHIVHMSLKVVQFVHCISCFFTSMIAFCSGMEILHIKMVFVFLKCKNTRHLPPLSTLINLLKRERGKGWMVLHNYMWENKLSKYIF